MPPEGIRCLSVTAPGHDKALAVNVNYVLLGFVVSKAGNCGHRGSARLAGQKIRGKRRNIYFRPADKSFKNFV